MANYNDSSPKLLYQVEMLAISVSAAGNLCTQLYINSFVLLWNLKPAWANLFLFFFQMQRKAHIFKLFSVHQEILSWKGWRSQLWARAWEAASATGRGMFLVVRVLQPLAVSPGETPARASHRKTQEELLLKILWQVIWSTEGYSRGSQEWGGRSHSHKSALASEDGNCNKRGKCCLSS